MSNSTAPAAALPPRYVQALLISSNLNSSMLFNFMMGIYTMVYVGTAYLYSSKRAPTSQRRVVMTAITLLYLLCATIFAIEWYFLQWSMIQRGATRASTFIASVSSPIWILASINTLQNFMIIIADGLLIWRCFYVWDRLWRMIVVPLVLLFGEVALLIPTTYFRTTTQATTFNNLNSSTLFISTATTVVTTVLIGYRIYSAGAFQEGLHGTGIKLGRFKHIVEVLVQSAAVYSVAILANAICIAIPSTKDLSSPVIAAETYLELIICITSGMAPTVIVARIVMTNPEDTFPSHGSQMSGLQFEPHRSTIQIRTNSGSQTQGVHTIDLEMGRNSDAELHSDSERGKKRASLID